MDDTTFLRCDQLMPRLLLVIWNDVDKEKAGKRSNPSEETRLLYTHYVAELHGESACIEGSGWPAFGIIVKLFEINPFLNRVALLSTLFPSGFDFKTNDWNWLRFRASRIPDRWFSSVWTVQFCTAPMFRTSMAGFFNWGKRDPYAGRSGTKC